MIIWSSPVLSLVLLLVSAPEFRSEPLTFSLVLVDDSVILLWFLLAGAFIVSIFASPVVAIISWLGFPKLYSLVAGLFSAFPYISLLQSLTTVFLNPLNKDKYQFTSLFNHIDLQLVWFWAASYYLHSDFSGFRYQVYLLVSLSILFFHPSHVTGIGISHMHLDGCFSSLHWPKSTYLTDKKKIWTSSGNFLCTSHQSSVSFAFLLHSSSTQYSSFWIRWLLLFI